MLLAGPPASGQHTEMVNQILRSASAEFLVAHAPIRQISSLMRWLLEIESVYYVGTGYYSSPHSSRVLPMVFPIMFSILQPVFITTMTHMSKDKFVHQKKRMAQFLMADPHA